MNGPVIRPLGEQDGPAWRRLWRGYLDFYGTELPEAITALTWRRLLEPAGPLFGLGAEHEGTLAGFAHGLLHPGTWSREPYCYLEDLFVASDARRAGVGRALIEAVYREADRRGAPRVYWLTQESNTTARALYDRIGQRSGYIHYTRPT